MDGRHAHCNFLLKSLTGFLDYIINSFIASSFTVNVTKPEVSKCCLHRKTKKQTRKYCERLRKR